MTEAMTLTGLHVYLRELREQQNIPQQDLADAMGINKRTLTEWESGRQADIKARSLIGAIVRLGASFDDIRDLVIGDAGPDEGRRRALEHLSSGARAQIRELEKTEEGRQALIDAAQRYLSRKERTDKPERRK